MIVWGNLSRSVSEILRLPNWHQKPCYVTFESSFIPRFSDARFQQVVLICLVVEQVFVFSLLANSFYCTLYELGVG